MTTASIVLRYSSSLRRTIAQIVFGGRPEERKITSPVVKASSDGRTVQTRSGTIYPLTGLVLLQREAGKPVEVAAAEDAPVRWSSFVDGVEPLEVVDADQS